MAPNLKETDFIHLQAYKEVQEPLKPKAEKREYTILYHVVLLLAYLHIGALYGVYLGFTSAKWATVVFNIFVYIAGSYGVSAGVHRLWSHRAYKAKMPLQIMLMLMQSLTGQTTIFNWARDHRLHHKYCDTDADPHSSARGVFFSHIGWLLVKRHPECLQRGKEVDVSDLMQNPVVMFQKKYYSILSPLMVFILPTLIPMYFWNESLSNAFHVHLVMVMTGANVTFCVNSIAHAFGDKPYDKNMSATKSFPLSFFSSGGHHNYHHAFPFDYRSSEFANDYITFATDFINFFARIGWAYDLKYATPDMIANRASRTGDGTYHHHDE
ncbi:acyl-CoA Delta(11) desaturase-like [Cydia fagiglandana]|uniref:acyl-CoA Delta(11) desaturase-like n=1 Tax=Cydia fagiglandana TaxID=1458189 RepID=UPI002FEE20E2